MAEPLAPALVEKIKNTHVLIVEDEAVFREALVYEFRRLGFKVSSAENGSKAIELLDSSEPVNVVISDIRMPGGDGIGFLKYAREKNPTIPIVMMMTGYSEMSSEEALVMGADALFSKPFDRKVLVDAVMKLVVSQGEEFKTFAGSVPTDLKIKMNFNHEDKFIESRVVTLSPKGLFVSMEQDFPEICDEISFDVQFNDEEWWKPGTGLVKWVSFRPQAGAPSGFGIEFVHVTDQGKKKIADIIKGAQSLQKA